ncbi:MAG: cobalamin-dependent protein [bacterium]
MNEELSNAMLELKRDDVLRTVKQGLESGDDPLRILEACRRGMALVGERFQSGDYYLAEMMLAGEIFKSVVAVLDPHLSDARRARPRGKVVLATLKGDIHDLGKDLLATLLRAQGFEVLDLGVDVDPSTAVRQIKSSAPDFVGFSALLTSAFPNMKAAAELLEEEGLRSGLKLMVGGGVTTALVRDYVGADFQTTDAMQGVAYCLRETEGK